MAKDEEKKRKLERGSLESKASAKRVKKTALGSKESNANKPESSTSPIRSRSNPNARQQSQGNRKDVRVYDSPSKNGGRAGDQSARHVLGDDDEVAKLTTLSSGQETEAVLHNSTGASSTGNEVAALTFESAAPSLDLVTMQSSNNMSEKYMEQLTSNGSVVERQHSATNRHQWCLSSRSGGKYIDQDPIFVRDEHGDNCIIAANQYEILLMSLETSQVIRSYAVPDGRHITCFCLGLPAKKFLEVAYDNGEVVRWDWKTSKILASDAREGGHIISMAKVSLQDNKVASYQVVHRDGRCMIIRNGDTLYTTTNKLKHVQVLHNASYVVAMGPSGLVVGSRKDNTNVASEEAAGPNYSWVAIPHSRHIFTCFDASVTVIPAMGKKSKKQQAKLAIAVGNASGQILLYPDVLSLFSTDAQMQPPRVLHWHPESVSTVRFAENGNYLMSGGRETVLVFWQLATGKRTYLPHLPAEIERLVLSPDGTHYALQLGDNSILILNSTEQKAIANFPGLQVPSETMSRPGPVLPKLTAVLHPQNSQRLLLTVPASNPKQVKDITARPFLQTFDTRDSRHISRQALARNTITDFNTGPDMRPVIPPDVHLLAISRDGRWLATLDEWIPQALDLQHLVPQSSALDEIELHEVQEQQHKREEVFLKIWRWQDKGQTWALNTRVESPHGSKVDAQGVAGPGQVFQLIADPFGDGFATIGEDACVKIWQPKVRTRHGVPLQNGNREELSEWVCRRQICVPTSEGDFERGDSPMDSFATAGKTLGVEDATLAISEDGSLIACALSCADSEKSPVIHFISASTGDITTSKTHFAAPGSNLVAMAFLKRYLIVLSVGALRVWDLIEDELQYSIVLPETNSDADDPMLAIDPETETFALLSSSSGGGSRRKVQIFGAQQRKCLLDTVFPSKPLAILAGSKGRCYTIVFDDGTVRTISQGGSIVQSTALDFTSRQTSVPLIEPSVGENPLTLSEMGIPHEDVEMEDPSAFFSGARTDAFDDVEDDRPVVRPEQLASVFDVGQNLSLPPVKDMFHAVVELFARKPRLEGVDVDAMEVDLM